LGRFWGRGDPGGAGSFFGHDGGRKRLPNPGRGAYFSKGGRGGGGTRGGGPPSRLGRAGKNPGGGGGNLVTRGFNSSPIWEPPHGGARGGWPRELVAARLPWPSPPIFRQALRGVGRGGGRANLRGGPRGQNGGGGASTLRKPSRVVRPGGGGGHFFSWGPASVSRREDGPRWGRGRRRLDLRGFLGPKKGGPLSLPRGGPASGPGTGRRVRGHPLVPRGPGNISLAVVCGLGGEDFGSPP